MRKYIVFVLVFLSTVGYSFSQHSLKPGFDGNEYRNLLRLAFGLSDTSAERFGFTKPNEYTMVYRSKEVGLYNRWDLWINNDSKIAVINIRGTISRTESWLENFYAAMVPAIGSLQINDSTLFSYKMAKDSNATVHIGWMLGVAHLAPDIVQHIYEYYKKGFKDFIICGHSQGGVLSLLMRSYLEYNGNLPKDILYKTYASAAPKPGNLYYAYDFDFITRNGWAYRIVNSLDWVPETPFSIQTLNDYNEINGLTALKPAIKKQKFLVRWYLNGAYNKMDKSTTKAVKKMQKNLGYTLYKMVRKTLPQYKEPAYAMSNNYMPAGVPIILKPDEKYSTLFKEKKNSSNPREVFVHHMLRPYLYLSKLWYP